MKAMKPSLADPQQLSARVKQYARELGFQQAAITDTDLRAYSGHLAQWLGEGRHGDMAWMRRHMDMRADPAALVPGAIRVISARMDYLPPGADMEAVLRRPEKAYLSRYAVGRDYHKLMRRRLQKLMRRIEQDISQDLGGGRYRVFTDSAPVMEKALAEKAGLGWIGKHTNLINKQAGSWFFLGEIYTDLPLAVDRAVDRPIDRPPSPPQEHCGECRTCMDVCPTGAITAPYQLDARLCISYLTIEHQGAIPLPLRPLIGNRVYGCDDCQLCCPWNRFADFTQERDFHPRQRLDDITLLELLGWNEAAFLQNTRGSAIRRIGYQRWLRNLAVAAGNCATQAQAPRRALAKALAAKRGEASQMAREHIDWALGRLRTNGLSVL